MGAYLSWTTYLAGIVLDGDLFSKQLHEESSFISNPAPSVVTQTNLYSRLQDAFESGRGSVRVLVVNYNVQELCVDMKVRYGTEQKGTEDEKNLGKVQIQLRNVIFEGD